MTWTELLANKDAQRHATSKQELDSMRELVALYLPDRRGHCLPVELDSAQAYRLDIDATEQPPSESI